MQLEYEKDFYYWINKNIELLKLRNFAELDIDNLIDELESMAKRDKRELISRLMVLIAHLLKWQYQPNHQSSGWRGSIVEQRIKIGQQLEDSPSLSRYLEESVMKAYPNALTLVEKETGVGADRLPQQCPYSVEQLLDQDFYPVQS
ncbi:DUF29 domain-containing protein [Ectothiorhodospiraceae bacterium BW-2]|nr:DUF29 domain-containing protein [Ectothiorhodospiraceae bacterium BW-2]